MSGPHCIVDGPVRRWDPGEGETNGGRPTGWRLGVGERSRSAGNHRDAWLCSETQGCKVQLSESRQGRGVLSVYCAMCSCD